MKNPPAISPQPHPHHLRVAMDAAATAYRRAAQHSAPGECWDALVLTATNDKQAAGYRQELALRHSSLNPHAAQHPAFFPALQRSFVIADPPGPRIGSGGATLNVLRALILDHGFTLDRLHSAHLLLIHSGGMSQRLPAYSPVGKIFTPLPLLRPDGQIATLFDHLYLQLAGLPERLGPGLLVAAGDVALVFDHRQIPRPPAGATAITMSVPAHLGTQHGVFLLDHHNRITRTLQKATLDQLAAASATDPQGQVLIDTGLLFFDPPTLLKLAHLAGITPTRTGQLTITRPIHDATNTPLDLYEDITGVLAQSYLPYEQSEAGEVGGPKASEGLPSAGWGRRGAAAASRTKQLPISSSQKPSPLQSALNKSLHSTPFTATKVNGEFLHLGTTLQYRDALTGRSTSPASALLQQNTLTHSTWTLPPTSRVFHSLLTGSEKSHQHPHKHHLGQNTVIEHSILTAPSHIGAGSVISQVDSANRPIHLPPDHLFFQVPVRIQELDDHALIGFAQVICGVTDDFKGKHADDQCQFLNQPISHFLKRLATTPAIAWPDTPAKDRTLWNARLFPVTTHRADTSLAISVLATTRPTAKATRAWRTAHRLSMHEILQYADPEQLIEHRQTIAALLQAHTHLNSIVTNNDTPLETVIQNFSTSAPYDAATHILESFARLEPADSHTALLQARAAWSAAQLLARPTHPNPDARTHAPSLQSIAFDRIATAAQLASPSSYLPHVCGTPQRAGEAAEALASAVGATRRSRGVANQKPSRSLDSQPLQQITATAPVRLDLAGGWSDTPPYCFERGGHVINLAINLNGQPPVRSTITTTSDLKIELHSQDLAQSLILTPADLHAEPDVHDPFALHKVALKMFGLLPPPGTRSIAAFLGSRLATGIHISTECRVPKGSGLGTSSILAATLLAALARLTGKRLSHNDLVTQTLLLEQQLSTGGGWQDQVGGIFPALKSAISAPGLPQRPKVELLRLPPARLKELESRLVVYYTGQQRLARNILRRVMGRYLAREPEMLRLMSQLTTGAAALRSHLVAGRWKGVGQEIARYWQIKQDLYPGSTTPTTDILHLSLSQHFQSASLAGAGGGGFGYFFCTTPTQAANLRKLLAKHPAQPGQPGTVYQTQINTTGLKVTTRQLKPPAR